MSRPQYWSIRQNPYARTNQQQMRDLIISQNVVTCPFGHIGMERNNVLDGLYNEDHPIWKSQSQDRKFIENMNIGDIILIPFAGLPYCILAEIKSDIKYLVNTGLFTRESDTGEIQVSNDNRGTPFRPIGRDIQIIKDNVILIDKRVLPRSSLSVVDFTKIKYVK
jgi:hypothetical protein